MVYMCELHEFILRFTQSSRYIWEYSNMWAKAIEFDCICFEAFSI